MGDSEKPGALARVLTSAAKDAAGDGTRAMAEGGDEYAVIGATVVGALRGAAKEGAVALADLVRKAQRGPALPEAVGQEVQEHLELVAPIIEENARELLEDESVRREDLASNSLAILASWQRAYQATGDSKKRRIIMAALGNAFRPELFKSGLTVRLFGILEELDYAEVRFLAHAFDAESDIERLWHEQDEIGKQERERNVLKRTVDRVAEVSGANTSRWDITHRLEERRLVTWIDPSRAVGVRITWLGRRLVALCQDTEALNRRWPDPDTPGDAEQA